MTVYFIDFYKSNFFIRTKQAKVAIFTTPCRIKNLSLRLKQSPVNDMKYTSYSYPSGRAEVAAFVVTGGVTEYHVMIHATDPKQTYREQMNAVLDAYAALLKNELSGAVAAKGYHTVLTENGSELSSGEKQLLSLARTLLSKAEVLLFDEITSALDAKTTKHIASLLADLKKDHTIIMITHKPEMMEKADQIAVLHKGKIVGVGDHQTLLKENEYYQQLQLRENESSFQSV